MSGFFSCAEAAVPLASEMTRSSSIRLQTFIEDALIVIGSTEMVCADNRARALLRQLPRILASPGHVTPPEAIGAPGSDDPGAKETDR
jgi:hypothetical protein